MNPSQAIAPLQLGFLGGFARPTLDKLSQADLAALAKLPKRIFKDCLDYTVRDTVYIKGGTAVGTTGWDFYSVAKGGNVQVINDSTITPQKTLQETNLTQAGQLSRGRVLILESIQCRVTIPGNLDLTLQSTGNTTLPAVIGTNATLDASHSGIVVSGIEAACVNSLYLESFTGEKSYENGMAYEFPCEFGISGYASGTELGTVTAGSNISVNEAVSNNGFGRARVLRIPRVILPGQNFGVHAVFFNNFTPGRSFAIQMIYKGLLFRDVQ